MRAFISKVEAVLERSGIEFCESKGCFEIAAKCGNDFFMLKVLRNVDSLQDGHASSLKSISSDLGGKALVVGERTRKCDLDKGIIYQRFEIPTVSVGTLENILGGGEPLIKRDRGGLFLEIDSKKLRDRRKGKGLTQDELAKKCGTTKKNIYEHEKNDKSASKDLVCRIESVLGNVTKPVCLNIEENSRGLPSCSFESFVSSCFHSMGYDTNFVFNAPFNIIAKSGEITILSEADESGKNIKKVMDDMIHFSRLCNRPPLAITRDDAELEIPSICGRDLKSYTAEDIKKLVLEW
jgi:putative transcriptional regulator